MFSTFDAFFFCFLEFYACLIIAKLAKHPNFYLVNVSFDINNAMFILFKSIAEFFFFNQKHKEMSKTFAVYLLHFKHFTIRHLSIISSCISPKVLRPVSDPRHAAHTAPLVCSSLSTQLKQDL